MSELTRIISLMYRMTDDDERRLFDDLVNMRVVMYQTAIEREARRYGNNLDANPPSGRDYAEIRRMSERDAASIVRTYNRDVERQVERLYAQNSRGNRNYYASNMERWASQRTTWKQAQIALNTDTTTTEYARRRWFEENFDSGLKWRMVGGAAVCKDCISIMAKGTLTQQFVDSHPCPRHYNCIHAYAPINPRRRADRDTVWMG